MLRRHGAPTVGESLAEYGRGVGGGFLFSLPLLFTMEVWTAGMSIGPGRLLAGLAATYVLLCGFNAFAGLRYDANAGEILVDSVEELGIGLVLSALILLLLGRYPADARLADIAGQSVLEGLFVAVGVSVGTAQLSGGGGQPRGIPRGRQVSLPSELVLAICGALLIGANVAPTDEVVQLAAQIRPWQGLAVVLLSLALAATLMYFSHFLGSARFGEARGPLSIAHGTAITYAAALLTSAALLWFFGRFAHNPVLLNVTQCVLLGLVATLGAAAGRLLLR